VTHFSALPAGTTLSGLMDADIAFRGNQSAVEKKNYEAIYTAGKVSLSNVNYTSAEYPDGFKINDALFTFNPKNVTINTFEGNYAKTDYAVNGSLDNLVGYALNNQPLEGKMNFSAGKINLNEWMGTSADTAVTAVPSPPFAVPGNIVFLLNTKLNKVVYDKVEYNNVVGTVLIKDQTVYLKNVKTEALDGSISMDGYYSTKQDKQKPDINIAYSVKDLDIQKTFYAFNTVQKIMPVGKYIDGKLTSQLTMTGTLGGTGNKPAVTYSVISGLPSGAAAPSVPPRAAADGLAVMRGPFGGGCRPRARR
jgi:hypothetical protein